MSRINIVAEFGQCLCIDREGDPRMGSHYGQASRAGIERRLREVDLYLMQIERDRHRLSMQRLNATQFVDCWQADDLPPGTDRSIGHVGTKTVFVSRVRISRRGCSRTSVPSGYSLKCRGIL